MTAQKGRALWVGSRSFGAVIVAILIVAAFQPLRLRVGGAVYGIDYSLSGAGTLVKSRGTATVTSNIGPFFRQREDSTQSSFR